MTPPLREPDVATLREGLAQVGYTAEAVVEPDRRAMFLPANEDVAVDGDPWLTAVVALLALGREVPVDALDSALVAGLEQCGLIYVADGHARANYRLVPYDGLLLAGDLRGVHRHDLVSPFTGPSIALARMMPRKPMRALLDLGTGSGVLALIGARHIRQTTAVDINPRALMFAKFNAAINATESISWLRGSWFEPVVRDGFDLVVCNPPYAISPDQEFTYRDSGAAPGALLGQLCREAAARLAPGGLAILRCSWPNSDAATETDDWADTPTAWVQGLGCDALILCVETMDPLEHAVRWNTPPVNYLGAAELSQTVSRWLAYDRVEGIASISFGTIVLRRSEGTPWLVTMPAAPPGDRAGEHLNRLLEGQDLVRSSRDLLAGTFSLPDGISISQRFQRRSAHFTARPAMVKLDDGLGVQAAIDPDALSVVFACDGRRQLKTIPRAEKHLAAIRKLAMHGLLSHSQSSAPTAEAEGSDAVLRPT